jgi:hypothetical protein
VSQRVRRRARRHERSNVVGDRLGDGVQRPPQMSGEVVIDVEIVDGVVHARVLLR